MAETTTDWTIGLGRLGAKVRRRWRVALAVCIVVLGASAAAGTLAPHQYSATSSVTVSPIRLSTNYSGTQDINIATERAVIGSRQVAALAAASLHPTVRPDALVAATSVAAPSGSTVLQVTVTAATPQSAADEANAIASAYLTFRSQSALDSAKASIDALEQRIAATDPKSTGALTDLKAQLTTLQHIGDGTARIIGRAAAPSSASSTGLSSYLIGGLIGGLLLGAILALAWDLADRRVRFAGRYSELFRRTAVIVRGLEDVESARWMLRGIRQRAALRRPIVAVTALDGTTADEVFGAMSNLARRSGLELRIIDAEDGHTVLDESKLPALLEGDTADLVLVNATRIDSGAEQASLADAVDAVIVVGSRAARVARVVEARDRFDDVAPGKLLPVYLEARKRGRRYTRPDATDRRPAPVDLADLRS